jgi:hypothetical protein
MRAQHPKDWKRCQLGNLLRIKHGFAFKGEFFAKEGDLVVLTPGNFREEGGLSARREDPIHEHHRHGGRLKYFRKASMRQPGYWSARIRRPIVNYAHPYGISYRR